MVSLRTLTQDIVAGLDTGKDAERYFGTPTGIPFSSVYIMLSPFGATEGKNTPSAWNWGEIYFVQGTYFIQGKYIHTYPEIRMTHI